MTIQVTEKKQCIGLFYLDLYIHLLPDSNPASSRFVIGVPDPESTGDVIPEVRVHSPKEAKNRQLRMPTAKHGAPKLK